jgi:hypothetical protein
MISKLIIRGIAAVLPALLTVAMINYRVDPALILRDGEYERQVAQGILDGKIVGITTNYSERKALRFAIQDMDTPPDGIIVGNSRVMSIPCDALGFSGGFNSGVSVATIIDIISIIGMYDSRNILPDSVVIGVDPFLFNDNHGNSRYMELITEYNEFSQKLGLERLSPSTPVTSFLTRMEQVISPSYFRASLQDIHRTPPIPIMSDKILLSCNNRLPDGSIVYSDSYRFRTEEAVNREVLGSFNSVGTHQSSGYRELSSMIIKQFTALTNYLMEQNVNIILVLAPFHPLLYEQITQNSEYRLLVEAEDYIKKFATARNIDIIGSYDPSKVGAVGSDFYDGYHPKREFMEHLLNN